MLANGEKGGMMVQGALGMESGDSSDRASGRLWCEGLGYGRRRGRVLGKGFRWVAAVQEDEGCSSRVGGLREIGIGFGCGFNDGLG
ncbi:hypothetical protein MRB53_013257 [Persea americana]|uniref:Uncharacterized protein n=1 Tax=Persea americana TaxID=3435 RepID=A0ACC2K7H8_PERAE|nr:hypothetical protein MRB53_013257 [Persea americana]